MAGSGVFVFLLLVLNGIEMLHFYKARQTWFQWVEYTYTILPLQTVLS
jgi:hypothetical protein